MKQGSKTDDPPPLCSGPPLQIDFDQSLTQEKFNPELVTC